MQLMSLKVILKASTSRPDRLRPIRTEDSMSRLLIAVLLASGTWSVAAQQQAANVVQSGATKVAVPKSKQAAYSTIQGNALDSTNGQMSGVVVRLRDARFGRIVDTQLTDKAGLFAFRGVE